MPTAQLTGHFFLAMPPSRCTSRDGQHGVLLRVREPAPSAMFPDGFTAVWLGRDAEQFMREHGADPLLRAGRGFHLTVSHFMARDGEIRARVKACELLPPPPSWTKSGHAQHTHNNNPLAA